MGGFSDKEDKRKEGGKKRSAPKQGAAKPSAGRPLGEIVADILDMQLDTPIEQPFSSGQRVAPNPTGNTLRTMLEGTLDEASFDDLKSHKQLVALHGKDVKPLLQALDNIVKTGKASKAEKALIGRALYPVVMLHARVCNENGMRLEGGATMGADYLRALGVEGPRSELLRREMEERAEFRAIAAAARLARVNIERGIEPLMEELAKGLKIQLDKGMFVS